MQTKKKLIAQFGGKLRDERFEPNQSMIEYYLPNKNERATVALKSKFLELNFIRKFNGAILPMKYIDYNN